MSEIVEFQPKKDTPKDLTGRLMMLNLALANPITKRFQCGGFVVNSRILIAPVSPDSQQEPIHRALESGLLIDVTDNDVAKKGFEFKSSSTSKINSEDTNKKAFVSRDPSGRICVAIPKDEEERAKFEQEIKEKGFLTLSPEESEEFTGFAGGIIEEEI